MLIICNGQPPEDQLLRRLWHEVNLRIAADGGANCLPTKELRPDFVIGDLDSLASEVRSGLPEDSIIHVEEQDTNDADKAIRFCLDQGARTVHLLGASGKRLDQFLANLEVMYKYSTQMRIILWTEIERMEFISGSWKETLPPNCFLSLLPVFGGAGGVSTSGLAFPLQQQDMIPGEPPSGVSNKVIELPVRIEIETGSLLLVSTHKDFKTA